MGILKRIKYVLFGGKNDINKHVLTDEDRAHAVRIRQIKSQMKLNKYDDIENLQLELEKARLKKEIDELNNDFEYEYEDEPQKETEHQPNTEDNMLASLLSSVLQPKEKHISMKEETETTSKTPVSVSLSDKQIDELIEGIPKHQIRLMKAMSKKQLLALSQQKFPMYDEDTRVRAINKLKGLK